MCLFINSASARGLASTADRNEIYGNLNVNGSQHFFYMCMCVWVLCNYQCHNLLELGLCKVASNGTMTGAG